MIEARMRHWAALALCACAVQVGSAAGQTAGAWAPQELTAEESVRRALEESARVRAAEAEVEGAGARARELRAALLPAVRTQASYTRLGGDIPGAEFTFPGLDTTFTLIPLERNRYHSEVSVEQPLFAGGRLRQGVTAAEREIAAAEWRARDTRSGVALEARTAYWTLHGALAGVDALDAALVQVDDHLQEVQRRVEEGAALQSELLAARTRRSEVLLDRVEAANAVRVARLELNRLLGVPPGAELQLRARTDAEVEVAPLPPGMDALAAGAVTARPELLALEEQVAALRAQEAAARGGRLPELALVGRYVYARPNPYVFTEAGSFHGTWEAGVSLRWGVWEGGAQEARVAQVREQRRAAEARLEEARQLAVVDVSRRYLEAERATEALEVAAQTVDYATEALRVTRQQFQEGVALSSRVLEAEASYRQALARQARAMSEYAIARAALLRSLGET